MSIKKKEVGNVIKHRGHGCEVVVSLLAFYTDNHRIMLKSTVFLLFKKKENQQKESGVGQIGWLYSKTHFVQITPVLLNAFKFCFHFFQDR